MSTSAKTSFWELAAPLTTDPAITRSTMMGYPCVRLDGRFVASIERKGSALLVKLPQERVAELIATGQAQAFAPARRTFREWAAIPATQRSRWDALSREALAFVQTDS